MYYKGMTGTPEEGHVVEGALAYDYALERCLKGTEGGIEKSSARCLWNGFIPGTG